MYDVDLKELYLAYNQITKIENLESLVNLKELYLDYNQITKIENLENLINLKVLYLYDNQITKITRSCYDFLKLKNVIIYGCDIDKLEIVEEN